MKLADMGRCKLLRKDGKSLPLVFPNQSTSSCLTRGIPSRCYAAPEIWSGGDITEKVDVYSFGVICWSMVQNREPNPCNIDPKRPGHIDTGTLDVESNWPCEFKNMLLACFRTDSSKRPTFKKILSALDKMLQTGVEKTCTSSSSSHQISQKSSGKVCTSVNGSNVSNVSNISNVSSSSVENESIADSKLTLVSTTNTDTNNSHSHQGGKRKSKLSFKDKYIMPLVNRFSAAMSTHSSRDSLSESTEHHRGGSVGNGIVQPEQDSMTKKEEFAEYIPFEASVSGRGSSFVRTVSPSPMVVVAASVSSQIVPRSTRDKISDSILSVLTTGSSSAAHRSNESGGHNIDNSSSSNNSLRRSQRYDAFCCTENVGMRSGPSLLNLQVHSFGSAGTSRPLNVSRNGSQSTLHPTSVNAQSNNNILRTKNKAAPNLNNDDEHLLSFAESIAPGNLTCYSNSLFDHITHPLTHILTHTLSSNTSGHHMDVSLLERQGIECLVVTDAELTGWTFVTDGCTSQVFQCMYGGTMVLVKSFDVYTSLENKGALQEFEFECQTLASGKHPNIARALARSQPGTLTIGFGTKTQYIVMEHCLSMGTLASLLEEGTLNYPFVRLLSLAKDLASALSYMHHELNQDGAVIHGDLNPDCIGINKEGRMKLADMGRCKLLRKDGKSLPLVFPNQSTSSCLTRGVPSRCYVAPEIWSGGDITEKVDVYSFGVICWSMLQNREPGPCHIDSKRPGCIDPSTLDLESHWPCEFSALLVACWSRDVTKRPTFKKIVSALDKFSRSTRLTPMHSPTSSMKTPRELSRGISGNSMHTSGKDGGWMPPVAAEATKHHNHNHNHNHNNDDLNPDLPGSPAVLNVTRKSFAEKFSKVVADVLPLFRNGHSGSLNHTATMTSRRSTPTENSPNTIDMTRKSMPLGRIPGLAATKSPSNGSMSTAPMSTHTLGSIMGSSSRLSSMVDSTKDPLIGHIDKVNNGNHGIDVSHQSAKWHAEVASRNLNRSALASISSPVPFSHTPEGSSTMPNLIKGTCSLPRI